MEPANDLDAFTDWLCDEIEKANAKGLRVRESNLYQVVGYIHQWLVKTGQAERAASLGKRRDNSMEES